MRLAIDLDAERVAVGEEVTGRVLVLEGGRSRSLTLTLSFRERSPAYLETPLGTAAVLHRGDLATGQAFEFRVELPAGALPSVHGKHGELFWEVEAASDEPGLDTRVSRRVEVTVAPTSSPDTLPSGAH
ncbi:MAG: hypothetical protein M3321_02850 [Actinomycetota bacterium]|nr:hypothetical protein [Actinomycetota bacterium]